jgi:hypothetical protein
VRVAAGEARRIRSSQHAGRCYPLGEDQGCSKTNNRMSSAAGPDPHTRLLLAVINVTGPWTKVHSDTLGWLYQIALRIEDAVRSAPHRMQWQRLGEAAGPLERIGGPALVIDRDGVVVTSHQWTFQAGDRVLAKAAGIAPDKTFLPALGWCVLEPCQCTDDSSGRGTITRTSR